MKIITILGIKLAGLREILEARVGIEPNTELKARKLLIPLNAKNVKNTKVAQPRYTAGTWAEVAKGGCLGLHQDFAVV
jgi:hypothetical protein